jgi:hypothetical protein
MSSPVQPCYRSTQCSSYLIHMAVPNRVALPFWWRFGGAAFAWAAFVTEGGPSPYWLAALGRGPSAHVRVAESPHHWLGAGSTGGAPRAPACEA